MTVPRSPKGYFYFALFAGCLILAIIVGKNVNPVYSSSEVTLDVQKDDEGKQYYLYKGKPVYISGLESYEKSSLNKNRIAEYNEKGTTPAIKEAFANRDGSIIQIKLIQHYGVWSLLPAFVAIFLCVLTREPVTSLAGGIIAGAFLIGSYDVSEVLNDSLATSGAAKILILYLWFLGGLMGIWSKTGAAQAFAQLMTDKIVKGPKTAKFVSWFLGVLFFQGGTMSTVLVGTTVKPIADKEKVSHEELSYIVDSTASPIASQLAFNAWPGYVQAFIFVPGVAFLATDVLRIEFFFSSVPFCFYAIFAVLSTFLLSIDKLPFMSKSMRSAIKRSRETGELDAPGSEPLSSKELQTSHVPEGYKPAVGEFFVPLFLLIGIAIGTFVILGSPKILWAFGIALVSAMLLALARGMSLTHVMEGFADGLKGVVLGSVILLLAVTIGGISKNAGGGIYLVELLGSNITFWLLPLILFCLTIVIAFSTGTSWGTYAVAFPLAMPLAWAVAQSNGLENPILFMTICFAAVMDGSVFGDQCSPISDTTVLSSMCTGCDLMDHVKTQIPQASLAAGIAAVLWTGCAALFC